MSMLQQFFSSAELSPHGFCLLWRPELLWLHVVSDTLIGVAYYTIPLALVYFVWKREDIVFGWIFWMFGAFILACGTTHWVEVWTLWHADYAMQGLIKAVTAGLSIATALLLWPLLPQALALPSPATLRRVNAELSLQISERNTAVEALQREMIERQQAEDALRQSQKLEALGQLTGGVAHDFSNLLLILRTNLYLLRETIAPPELQARLATMETAVARGEGLTRHLLAFGRRQSLQPKPVELRDQLAKTAELLRRSLGEDIDIRLEVPADIWPIEIDPQEFELALINLAVNAKDAMPAGGTLAIGARNATLGRMGEAIEDLEGGFVAISMRDNGTGIPPAIIARVFEPFFTTKETGKGTGLGLSQVYGFAKQSGGTAVISSAEGRGTTVTLFLPRAARRPAAVARGSAEAMTGSRPRRARILLVEDNTALAEASGALLRGLGYTVTVAASGQEALDWLAASDAVDLLFSDVVMPGGMNGVELARLTRKRYPALPVLLTTGCGAGARQATDGGFPLLTKPYQPKVLATTIDRLLQTPRHVDP
jgi:signal transduction histidine kinase/CheY-like chemotaxis protein